MAKKFAVRVPDHGEDTWAYGRSVQADSPLNAAEEYVERMEARHCECAVAFGHECLVVHVKDESSGREYRFSVSGETVPRYRARLLEELERKGAE